MREGHDPATGQQRRLATLERLLAIEATDVTSALVEARDVVVEAVGADTMDAFLLDPASETLVAMGTSTTPLGRRQRQLGLNRLPLANGGPTVAVYQTGASYHTGHADADPSVPRGLTSAEGLGMRSLIDVRFAVDEGRRGVFEVSSTRPDAFSAEDLRFCEAVGRWVGLVAHRAALGERVTREAAAQARRATAEDLITVLAHDLRAPLTPLRGYHTILRERMSQEGRLKDVGYVEQAARAAARLEHMITALLDAERLRQGIFALSLQPVDLAALTRETAAVLRSPTATVRVQTPDELVLLADPERLAQALENLLGNAVAHAPADVPVVVQLASDRRAEGAWAVLSVRDAGPGIAPDQLSTLFERFARGSGSTGLGLGLYLARGIAEAHGGTLTVDAHRGTGTTFRLALPVVAAQR